jgi:molybdopterin converting factor small subunit
MSASGCAETAPAGRVVSVKFLGYLRRVAGHREIEVAVDADTTVDDLLQTLARTHGEVQPGRLPRAGRGVHTYLRVFLNEEEARMTDRVAPGGSPAEMALLVVPGFEGGR